MVNILISTVYDKKWATIRSVNEYQAKKVILLLDKNPNEKQKVTANKIKGNYSNVLEIKEEKIDLTDVLSISKDVKKIIDKIPEEDDIYIDVSQGKKTQFMGILLACYTHFDRIKQIVYWEKDKPKIIMPKLSIKINGKKRKILELIEKTENLTYLSKELEISRTMVYKHLKNLEEKGYVIKENGKFKVTDIGKIAIL